MQLVKLMNYSALLEAGGSDDEVVIGKAGKELSSWSIFPIAYFKIFVFITTMPEYMTSKHISEVLDMYRKP